MIESGMELYLALLLVGGVVAIDTTAGPQMLISEPIVSCTIAGYLAGYPAAGILTGLFFQLLWFGYLPLGAVRIPDTNMGAFIGASSLFTAIRYYGFFGVTMYTAVIPAIVIGVISSIIGNYLQAQVRRNNRRLSDRITTRLERGESVSITTSHLFSMTTSASRGIVMTAVLVPAGVTLCGTVMFLPAALAGELASSLPMLWGAACASAVIVSILKKQVRPLLLGATGGMAWMLLKTIA